MDYIYYSIYHFYLKLFNKQKFYDNPFFYCIAVISTIESLILNSFISLFFYKIEWHNNNYKTLSISILVVLFGLNWFYFSKREINLIKRIDKKKSTKKTTAKYISLAIIILTLIFFFYTSSIAREYNLKH